MEAKRNCPVCHSVMLDRPCEICPHCGWEKDDFQEACPEETEQANKMSLREAREAYRRGQKIE